MGSCLRLRLPLMHGGPGNGWTGRVAVGRVQTNLRQPVNSGDQRQSGTIKTWDDDKGFGFIELPGRRKDVFFHISAVETSRRRPKAGDEVIYVLEEGSQKKPRAEAVWLRGEPIPEETNLHRAVRTGFIWRSAAIPLFLLLYAALNWTLGTPWIGLAWFVLCSWVSYGLYASDKKQALLGRRRVPEASLFCVDLLGGWPGGLFAQVAHWHKTSKSSFQALYWLAVTLNILGIVMAALYLRSAIFRG